MLRAVLLSLLLSRSLADDFWHSKTLTDFTDASQEYFARFSKVVYSSKMSYFDMSEGKHPKFYIADPHIPIEFDNYRYYWNESYMSLSRPYYLCEYKITAHIDKELANTFYRDGTKPTSMFFLCGWSQRCVGLQCRFEIPLLPCFITPLLLLCLIFHYAKKSMKKAFEDGAKARAEILAEMAATHYSAPEPENSPPSYDMILRCSQSHDTTQNYAIYTIPKQAPKFKVPMSNV